MFEIDPLVSREFCGRVLGGAMIDRAELISDRRLSLLLSDGREVIIRILGEEDSELEFLSSRPF